jgi:hypothetical protein
MLGAMVMLLQRQLAAGHDDDALDLEALAAVDRLVVAQRTVHAAMFDRLRPALPLELGHQRLDLLGVGGSARASLPSSRN